MRKKIGSIIVSALAVAAAAGIAIGTSGCGNSTSSSSSSSSSAATVEDNTDSSTEEDVVNTEESVFTNYDNTDTWNEDSATYITLSDEDVEITSEGTYVISGTLTDGQIYINVADTDKVQLVLNGADITCSDSAAIFVQNADKVVITLAEDTVNTVTDGGDESTSDADGCIYSKDDLSINGSGKLIVNGTVKNGIDCNNDLKIVSGTIQVTAVDNGIKAKTSISVKAGEITVEAYDGIKVSDKSDTTVGTFYMEGGTVSITAEDDGISAAMDITITAGQAVISAVDKAVNSDGTENITDGCVTIE